MLQEGDLRVRENLEKTRFAEFHSSSPSLAIEQPKNTKNYDCLGTNSSSSSVPNKVAVITDNNPWQIFFLQKRGEYWQLRSLLQSELNELKKPIKSLFDVFEIMPKVSQIEKYDAELSTIAKEISRTVSLYLTQEKHTSSPMIAGALTTPLSNKASHSKTEISPKTEQGALTTPPSNEANQSKTANPSQKKQGALTTSQSNGASQSKTANPPQKKQGAHRFLTLSERYQRFAALKSSDDDSDS